MFSTEDTIVAIATPPGRSGIGVVRISGPDARTIAERLVAIRRPLSPRFATLAVVHTLDSDRPGVRQPIDQAIVTYFPAPHSYTGDDVVEVSTHGNPVVLQSVMTAAVTAGARAAVAGEFTLRAFVNGRIDLPQAEAVADLIDAVTPRQLATAFDQLQGTLTRAIGDIDADLFDLIARLEASIDFPEEGYHFITPDDLMGRLSSIAAQLKRLIERGRQGRIIREGRLVAIVGGPNVGKSSLFNALVGTARAIVTPVPGTTRDLVSECVDIEGIRITLVDTAGLRDTGDLIEQEGIARSAGAAASADLVVAVRDGTQGGNYPELSGGAVVRVDNKADLPGFCCRDEGLAVSALTGSGLEALRRAVAAGLGLRESVERPEITNTRHMGLVQTALESVMRAKSSLDVAPVSEEFLLADLQNARRLLEEVTGRRSTDEVIHHIFSRFCVGK